MHWFNVIDEVSQSLVVLLQNQLTELGAIVATDDLQGPAPSELRLTLFLFEVGEDPSARNRPRTRKVSGADILAAKPPMALLLRYLITPWGGTESTRHLIIGRAMQVLYDRPILSGAQLFGDLEEQGQVLKVTLAPLSLEERTRVWHSVQKPYRLSVAYEVRVVNLESEIFERARPVRQRTLDAAVPEGVA